MFAVKVARPVFLTFLSIASLVSIAPLVGCGTTKGSPMNVEQARRYVLPPWLFSAPRPPVCVLR